MRIAKSEIRQDWKEPGWAPTEHPVPCGPVRLELELLVEARSEELHEFAKHLADLVDRGVPVTIEEGVEPWRSTSDEVKRLRAETDLRSLRITDYTKQIQRQAKRESELCAQVDAARQRGDQEQGRKIEAQRETAAERVRARVLRDSVVTLKERIGELERERRELRRAMRYQGSWWGLSPISQAYDLPTLVERNRELTREAKHLAKDRDEWQRSHGKLVDQRNTLEKERDNVQRQLRLEERAHRLTTANNRIKDKALRIQTADLDRRNRRIEELKRQVSDLKVALELERDRVVKVDWATIDPYRCAPWEKTKAELEQENHQLAKAKNRALRQRDEVRGRVDRLREKVHKLEELLVEAGSDLCRARTELRQKTKHLSFDRWEGWENVRTLWAATSNLVARMRGAYYKGRTFEGQVQAVERALKATTWLR